MIKIGNNTAQQSKIRWLMLSFAFTATVMNYVDRLAFNYLSAREPLRHIIPDDAFGYIGTAFFIGYLVSNLGSGFVIDRLGTRLGYALCMAFWTTASLLQAIAVIPLHFGIFRALLGVGEAGNWPAAIKLSSEWFKPEERSTAIGIFNSGGAIGAIITPPLAIWLGNQFGWQMAFVCIGVAGYLWLAVFWFIYYTPSQAQPVTSAKIFPPMKLIRTRFVSWFTLSKVFVDPIWYFITFWIARYLVDVHGWNLEEKGWLLILPFLVADLGNVLGGYFTQLVIKAGWPVHRARKLAAGIFGSFMVLSLVLGPLIIHSPATALVILSCAAFGFSAYNSNTMAFPADVVPPNAIASVWGIASAGAGLGGMCFQSASGLTIKHLAAGHGYALAYNAVFIGYGILGLVGLCIVMFRIGPLVKNKALYDMIENKTTAIPTGSAN
jgi:ACS family hexuronate transporter-like MFS transporter